MQCGLREGMGELSNSGLRTSLMGRWIGIHVPMLETWIRFLVQEDPTCCGAATWAPLLKLACSRAPAHRRPWQWEAREPNYRGAPAPHRQKPVQQQRHSTTKNKIIKCSLKKKKWPEVPSVTEHLWSLGLAVFLSAPPISTSPSLPVLSAASERLPQPSCPGSGPSSEFSVASEFRDYYPSMSWRTENPRCRVTSRRWHCGDSIVSRHLTE